MSDTEPDTKEPTQNDLESVKLSRSDPATNKYFFDEEYDQIGKTPLSPGEGRNGRRIKSMRVSQDQIMVESTPFLSSSGVGRGRFVKEGKRGGEIKREEEEEKEGEGEGKGEEEEEDDEDERPPLNTKQKIGFFISSVGLIALFFSLGFYFGLPFIVQFRFQEIFIVDSVTSDGYNTWKQTCSSLFPPIFQSHFFFNLTNYEDVIFRNEKPIFQKTGPYTYIACKTKVNVDFATDGETVTYSYNNSYFFDYKRSSGNQKDKIISLNPTTYGLSSLTKTEDSLAVSLMYGYLSRLGIYFNDIFPEYVLNEYFMTKAAENKKTLIQEDTKTPTNFYEAWANYTTEEIQAQGWNIEDWNEMYLSLYNLDRPTGLSRELAALLWDGSVQYSMMNRDYESQSAWIAAEQNDDDATALLLEKLPNLSSGQLAIIVLWRSSFKRTYLPQLLDQINELPAAQEPGNSVSSMADIGGLQWATDALLRDSVYSVSPHDLEILSAVNVTTFNDIWLYVKDSKFMIPSMFPPEIAYWLASDSSLPIEDQQPFSVALFQELFSKDSELSLVNANAFLDYVFCDNEREKHSEGGPEMSQSCANFLSKYNWTNEQQVEFHDYLWSYLYPNLGDLVYKPEVGFGIISETTVKKRLHESRSRVLNNDYHGMPATYRTGKDNPAKTGEVVEWNSTSELCSYNGPECDYMQGFWNGTVPVGGFGDPRQFGVGVGEGGDGITVWSDITMRPMLYGNRGEVEIQGITARKFAIDNFTFPFNLDPVFDQNIYGFANMSHLSMKATQKQVDEFNQLISSIGGTAFNLTEPSDSIVYPFYLSFPDFCNCDQEMANTVTLEHPKNFSLPCDSYYSIEPNTGMVLDSLDQMQYNIFLQKNQVSWRYFENITGPTGEVMWPVDIITRLSQLSSESASELKVYFDVMPKASLFCLYIGAPLSILIVLIGTYISVANEEKIIKKETQLSTLSEHAPVIRVN